VAKNSYDGLNLTQTGSADSLPLKLEMRASRKAIFIPIVVAIVLVFLAFNIVDMVPAYMLGGEGSPLHTYLPWAIGAIAFVYIARSLKSAFAGPTTIAVDKTAVTVHSGSKSAKTKWSEPLANYKGVRWKRFAIHEDRGKRVRTRYRHVIELVHPDADKTVPLFLRETGRANALATLALARKAFAAKDLSADQRAELQDSAARLGDDAGANNPRGHWEHFASVLDLPAIDARDGAESVRAAQDVDKSIKTLAEEGKVSDSWQETAPPPSLEVKTVGGPEASSPPELHVLIRAGHVPRVFLFMLGGAGVLFLIGGVLTFHSGALLGAVLFGGAAYGITHLERKKPRKLIVTKDEIRYVDTMVSSRSFTVPLAAIENIQIRDRDSEMVHAQTMKLSGKELLISSDEVERAVAGGVPEDGLVWLRDCLTAKAARA